MLRYNQRSFSLSTARTKNSTAHNELIAQSRRLHYQIVRKTTDPLNFHASLVYKNRNPHAYEETRPRSLRLYFHPQMIPLQAFFRIIAVYIITEQSRLRLIRRLIACTRRGMQLFSRAYTHRQEISTDRESYREGISIK